MRYFFITGTSRGIGKALVLRILQEEDTQVYGFSRQASVEHARYAHRSIDLSDVETVAEQSNAIFPELEDATQIVLINNAGTLGQVKYMGNLDNLQFARIFNLNITAPAILMNSFIRVYQQKEAEKLIINVSSGAGKAAVDGWSGYCASKAALDMLSQVAQRELEEKNQADRFRVFALAPGVVDTAMQEEIRQVDQADFSKLNKFIKYKQENVLNDAAYTADKFMELINHSHKFNSVLQDVRQY